MKTLFTYQSRLHNARAKLSLATLVLATFLLHQAALAIEPVMAPGAAPPTNRIDGRTIFSSPKDAPHAHVASTSVIEGTTLEHAQAGVVHDSGYGNSWNAGDCYSGNGYSGDSYLGTQGISPVTVGPELAKLQFYLDLLILSREDADDTDLLFDSVTGDTLLTVGDLTSGAHTGLRIGAIFYDEGGRDLEFSVIAMDEFGEPVTRQNENPMIFPFFGGIPANPQTTYTFEYVSTFSSGEVNLRQRFGSRVTWLMGLRYAELNERFNVRSGNGIFASDTDNDLYGLQFGGEVCLGTIRRSILFASLKGGAYYNNADVRAEAVSGQTTVNFIDDEDEFAFLGDVSIGLLVPMGPQADLRIGYQGLFLDGVGLAPDQNDNFSLFTRSGTLDTSTVTYHGGFIGFDIFW